MSAAVFSELAFTGDISSGRPSSLPSRPEPDPAADPAELYAFGEFVVEVPGRANEKTREDAAGVPVIVVGPETSSVRARTLAFGEVRSDWAASLHQQVT